MPRIATAVLLACTALGTSFAHADNLGAVNGVNTPTVIEMPFRLSRSA